MKSAVIIISIGVLLYALRNNSVKRAYTAKCSILSGCSIPVSGNFTGTSELIRTKDKKHQAEIRNVFV